MIYGVSAELCVGCSAQLAKSKNVVVTDPVVNSTTGLGAINGFLLFLASADGLGGRASLRTWQHFRTFMVWQPRSVATDEKGGKQSATG